MDTTGETPDTAVDDDTQHNAIDWESIETHYRAGQLSIREIAKVHGISDTAIRKRAKVENWQRNLTQKVDAQVRTELVRTEEVLTEQVRSSHPAHHELTEREIINVAAAAVVQVVRSHRKQIAQGTTLVQAMMGQLMQAVSERAELEQAIEDETKGDRNQERYVKLMKAIALPTHASTMLNLANALKVLVTLERQAFSIGDELEAPAAPPEQATEGFNDLREAFRKRLAKPAPPSVVDATDVEVSDAPA